MEETLWQSCYSKLRTVALTSTLTVYETFTAGRPVLSERGRSVLIPQVREQYERGWSNTQKSKDQNWISVFNNEMKLERMFVKAGGFMMAGTDPTGYGGVVPGFASKREIELLVEAGFTFEEAIQMATTNGAKFMGREKDSGSIETGKRADAILVDGDPVKSVEALEQMPYVFKSGKGYNTAVIIDQLKETVGLY